MFDKAMEFIARWEWSNRKDGGYTNDPADPGGETRWGISKKAHPEENIKDLTYERACEIYKEEYWEPLGCSKRDVGLGSAIFDTAVNCGVARTLVWLDGSNNYKDLLEARRLHYDRIVKVNPKLAKFSKGWANRLKDLHKFIESIQEQKTL
jgi:hypothetical protein